MQAPETIITQAELATRRQAWAQSNARVAFVPTMGALHEGHLSLVERAKSLADRTIVSIFVNPLQFGPREDFSRYPRTLKADMELLARVGADAVFLPTTAETYPEGFATQVTNRALAGDLEGAIRPGHFDGVLTVVLKLLQLVQPHWAIFGKKDYQQWRLIERMAKDLCLPLTILGAETTRESDGLAMSSRNRYLTAEERQAAPILYEGLKTVAESWRAGERQLDHLEGAYREVVARQSLVAIDYLAIRRQDTLEPFPGVPDGPAVALCAARLGTTRLIDNIELT